MGSPTEELCLMDGSPGGEAPDGWEIRREPQMDGESEESWMDGGIQREEEPQMDGKSRGGAPDG